VGHYCPVGIGLITAGLFQVVQHGALPAFVSHCRSPGGSCSTVLHLCLFRLEAATTPATSDSYSDRASSRSSAYSRRENRLAALSSRAEEESNRDYKKVGFLYVVLSLDAPWKLQQLSLERFPLSVSIAFGKDAHCSQMHQSYRGLKQGRG